MERGGKGPVRVDPDLPADIKDAIQTSGYDENVSVWDTIKGHSGGFLRRIFHKQMEDRGEIPESTAEDDKKFLGY